jgi:uncharacterized membrane protein YedE/YeeE
MAGWLRRGRARRERQWRRRDRRIGCLMWLLVVILVVIALGLFFGGFRKGTKVGGIAAPAQFTVAAAQRPPGQAGSWATR